MKKILKKLFMIMFLLIIGLIIPNLKVKGIDESNELALTSDAPSAILMEATTQTVIYELDAKTARPPASMTKIMTMLLVMEAIEKGVLKMSDMLVASENATKFGGTQIYLEIGEQMSVDDLLKAVAIASANDAAAVLAESIGGSLDNFIKMMNDKGKDLGLVNTNFKNCNGLPDEGHYSCCYDMALMAATLINKYGETILKYTNTYEDYLRKGQEDEFWLVNTNKLVKMYPEVDGLKTGYIDDSKYCLTATMYKNNIRFISVVMGCSTIANRNKDTMSMLNYGVSTYELMPLFQEGEVIKNINDVTTKPSSYNIVVPQNISVLIKKGETLSNIKSEVDTSTNLGSIKVYMNNKLYIEVPLEIEEKITKANFFDIVFQLFKKLFLS